MTPSKIADLRSTLKNPCAELRLVLMRNERRSLQSAVFLEETHLLHYEQAKKHENEQVPSLSICGDFLFEHTLESSLGVSYLTLREFLWNRTETDSSFLLLNEEEFKHYIKILCPKCKNHPDLPMLALKELM